MSDIGGGNPKREILVDAMKELNMAQNSLRNEHSVNAQYARGNIMMALKLVKGVIACLEAPAQTYNLE
jgi:hypothetical protein